MPSGTVSSTGPERVHDTELKTVTGVPTEEDFTCLAIEVTALFNNARPVSRALAILSWKTRSVMWPFLPPMP